MQLEAIREMNERNEGGKGTHKRTKAVFRNHGEFAILSHKLSVSVIRNCVSSSYRYCESKDMHKSATRSASIDSRRE